MIVGNLFHSAMNFQMMRKQQVIRVKKLVGLLPSALELLGGLS